MSESKKAPTPSEGAAKALDTAKTVEERSHMFEQRHWVNEACGDDLWEDVLDR